MIGELRRAVDPRQLAEHTADWLIEQARRAVAARGRFRLALAGGATPRPVYELLGRPPRRDRIAWKQLELFWSDERCVPPDDDASNYRLVQRALLAHVELDEANVHRIRGELQPAIAAEQYERELGSEPLDLALLGMGSDGHTASLFPGSPALAETGRRAIAARSPEGQPPHERVTLAPRAIEEARAVAFLVSGARKAATLAEVLSQRSSGAPALPAARLSPASGALTWFFDEAAAADIPGDLQRQE